MPCYLCQEEMIAFDSPGAGRKQPGVRFDVDFDGLVAVDAAFYPKLNADDCRTLAGWLLRQADRMSQAWYDTIEAQLRCVLLGMVIDDDPKSVPCSVSAG